MRIVALLVLFQSQASGEYRGPFQCPPNGVALFFANGMNNLEEQAEKALEVLQEKIQAAARAGENVPKIVKGGNLYNTRETILFQILEAYMQKRHEFSLNFWNWLFDLSSAPQWFRDKLLNLIMLDEWTIVNPGDLDNQLERVHETLASDLDALIVAHSQGNFFANSVYRLVKYDLKNRVALTAVATPSDKVEGGGPYVTLSSDGVIVALKALRRFPLLLSLPLPPNISNETPKPGYFDHEFLKFYLGGSPAGEVVIKNALSQIKTLAETSRENIKDNSPTTTCIKWFNQGNSAKEKDFDSCWETCFSQITNLGTFECPVQCDSLCGCKRKSFASSF